MFGWACLAGFCNVVQAQMFDYHRTTYAQVVTKGRAPDDPIVAATGGPWRQLLCIACGGSFLETCSTPSHGK